MPPYFPWGLYRPYASLQGTDTLADIVVPLVVMLGAAVASAVPIFEMKGLWLAALYAFIVFHILCFLRRWVMGWMMGYPTEHGLYISPSLSGVAELQTTLFLSIFWIGFSFGIAYWMWGWKLPT